ncbi:MAG: AbiJ-NTD4 domain-containing protein [Terriglobales bacterium]
MGYFTDRNLGSLARTSTDLSEILRRGLVGLLRNRANDGSFGIYYPEQCPDGRGPTGTNTEALRDALAVHRLFNFLDGRELPSTYETLDLLEFGYEKVAEPRQDSYHGFYGHYHLVFAQAEGRARFREEINRIFERNGIAFELRETGQIERIAPEGLREALTQAVFHTGDDALDELLERARARFLNRDAAIRKESLETLWDAWERLKSLEGGDKRASTARILDRAAAEPRFRELLESEARLLTDIGNNFMIRHAEVSKTPIADEEHVDFLFHRLFAVIRLLLKKSNRGG